MPTCKERKRKHPELTEQFCLANGLGVINYYYLESQVMQLVGLCVFGQNCAEEGAVGQGGGGSVCDLVGSGRETLLLALENKQDR